MDFLVNINQFFTVATTLNHLNLSGMHFRKEQIRTLLVSIKQCVYLISLHLSDNNISQEREFYYEVLDEFNINEKDLLEINRSMINQAKTHPSSTKKYDATDIDYNHYLEEYLGYSLRN